MDELYKIQNVTYNATGGTLKNDKVVIDLTAQQNRLLRYLALNAGQTLTKEQITAHVWGYDVDSDVSNLIFTEEPRILRNRRNTGKALTSWCPEPWPICRLSASIACPL